LICSLLPCLFKTGGSGNLFDMKILGFQV